jgi:transposase-like protein
MIKEKVDEKVMEGVIYVIVGITLEGEKEMLGYYINIGSENKGDWLSVLNQLIDRGLKGPLMIVSDDFPGLIEAIIEDQTYCQFDLLSTEFLPHKVPFLGR